MLDIYFGVDSTEMIEKLEQYNGIWRVVIDCHYLQKVVDILETQSGPGGIHENTLLLVMGDHGQTINGDHGGGAPEEVETSLFVLSLQERPSSTPSETDSSACRLDRLHFSVPLSWGSLVFNKDVVLEKEKRSNNSHPRGTRKKRRYAPAPLNRSDNLCWVQIL